MKLNLQATIALLAIAVLGLCAVYFYQFQFRVDKGTALFGQFKAQCKIAEASPFVSQKFGFSFSFSNDQVVCEYNPKAPDPVGNEIYLLDKAAFNEADPKAIIQGTLGKVIINPNPPISRIPLDASVVKKTALIAGLNVEISEFKTPGCGSASCAINRIAIFEHNNVRFEIDEFSSRADIFSNFTFLGN